MDSVLSHAERVNVPTVSTAIPTMVSATLIHVIPSAHQANGVEIRDVLTSAKLPMIAPMDTFAAIGSACPLYPWTQSRSGSRRRRHARRSRSARHESGYPARCQRRQWDDYISTRQRDRKCPAGRLDERIDGEC